MDNVIDDSGNLHEPATSGSISLPGIGDRGLTLEQLRSFVAVVQCRGFHQAGAFVNRSQSAVTQNIKRLEECLGCSLLVRKQGRLQGITPEGRRFFLQAMGVLEQVEQAVVTLKRPALKGRVRLGVPDDFVIEQLHTVISRCLAIHPALHIDVVSTVSSTLQKLFQQRKLDIVIYKMLASQHEPDLTCEVLRSEPLYWVANKAVEFEDFVEIPLVVFPEGCAYRRAALAALEQHGKRWHIAYTSASYENIRRAVGAGLGIGILSRNAVGAQHVVLDQTYSFPELPMVDLGMVISNEQRLYRQVADYLVLEREQDVRFTADVG